jgi:predicted DNA-binding protein (MmcQ/YjbR family)
MDIDQLRKLCLSFPGATEQIQWENDLVFKVAGKMFAVTPLIPARVWLSLKADPEAFAELTERPGVIPAPYLARAKWIAIESAQTLPPSEVARLLRQSYDLVAAKLPRTKRDSLISAKSPERKPTKSGKSANRKSAKRSKSKNAERKTR